MDTRPIVQLAVEALGSQQALADRLTEIMGRHIKQQNVWRWVNTVKRLSGDYALPIEVATGGKVTAHKLRPDLYPLQARRRAG